jgi:hypothetical protein
MDHHGALDAATIRLGSAQDVRAGVTVIAPGNHDLTLADQLMKLVINRV